MQAFSFLRLLEPAELRSFTLLLVLMLLAGLVEVAGVASIMPFIGILSNPDFFTTEMFAILERWFPADLLSYLSPLLGFFVLFIFVFSLFVKGLVTYLQLKLAHQIERRLSVTFLEAYLRQPYKWFLQINSAELNKSILSDVSHIVFNGLLPFMFVVSNAVVCVFIFCLLVLVDIWVALFVGLSFSAVYSSLYYLTARFIERIGVERDRANEQRFQVLSEAFSSIKFVKIRILESFFQARFLVAASTFARYQAASQIIALVPKYGIEAFAFGGFLAVLILIQKSSTSFSEALPVMSLYVVAGYRLLPALQQVYGNMSKIKFVGANAQSLAQRYFDLDKVRPTTSVSDSKLNDVQFVDVGYKHDANGNNIVSGINFQLKRGDKVGVVGMTGSGKTTFIDLLVGLINPTEGSISYNGKTVTGFDRLAANHFGYVPQNIYLLDDSIVANIAFGQKAEDVDLEKMEFVTKVAEAMEFVSKRTKHGFDTLIGENAVRISGGQKQRLGIARALYANPDVLVLDEATSSLDEFTEQKIIKNIFKSYPDMTLIMVAHRTETLKYCNRIICLDEGKIGWEGDYNELKAKTAQNMDH